MCGFLDKYSARIVVVMMLLMRVFGRVQAFKTMYRAGRTATMMTTTRFTFVPRASLSPTTTWRLQSTLCEAASLEEEVPDSSSSSSFSVSSPFAPTADQPRAIETLLHQLRLPDNKYALLQGITGTGKTLVMSHVISRYGRPTLVLCHNKTLAAQLARELRAHLADSKVELFVSYYNHYVPESYQESTGRYVAKKSSVNSEIDILRHRATRALMTDAASQAVVVVASVSCIYGLGLPREYLDASMAVRVGDEWSLQSLYDKLASMLYTEHEMLEERGQFSVVSAANDKYTITLWAPHDKYPMQLQLEKGDGDGFVKVSGILQGTPQGFSTLDWARIFPVSFGFSSSL